MQRTLKSSELKRAALQLVRIDPALGDVLERLGTPPLWKRPVTFATLVHVLLEQQVSIVSARATFKRLEVACDGVRLAVQAALRVDLDGTCRHTQQCFSAFLVPLFFC